MGSRPAKRSAMLWTSGWLSRCSGVVATGFSSVVGMADTLDQSEDERNDRQRRPAEPDREEAVAGGEVVVGLLD